VGAILFGVSLVLSALTGWSQQSIILTAGAVVTIYTALGGIEAVIWTDVVQSIVLTVGAAVVLVLLLVGMPEGPGQAVRIAAQSGKLSLGEFAMDLTRYTFWVPLLYGLFENIKNFGIDQSYVQRYHASRSERQAARSVWIGALLYLPISAVFFAIGSFSYSYYHTHPEMLSEVRVQVANQTESEVPVEERAAALGDAAIGDSVLPHFIVNSLPVGATGLLIAAIFAAAMSSIDTSLNSSATVTLLDIYKRHLRPDCGERESMAVLYSTTAAMGAAGVVVAIKLIGVASVLDAWWTLSGIFSGGLLGLFLLGVVVKRATRPAAVLGVVVGLFVVGWLSLPELERAGLVELNEVWRNPLHAHLTIVVGTLTIFFVGLLATSAAPRSTATFS
jgi:SSS family solute:Na+ symporter